MLKNCLTPPALSETRYTSTKPIRLGQRRSRNHTPEAANATRKDYLRTRPLDQYRVNTAFGLFCNHSVTSSVWKGRSPASSSRLSNSAISSAVLGFLISFNTREMCASRRLDFEICLIPASSSRKMNSILRDYPEQGVSRRMLLYENSLAAVRTLEKVKAVT